MKNHRIFLIISCVSFLAFCSCRDATIPKPRGYFKIELDEKEYQSYKTRCGYSFETPTYSNIEVIQGSHVDSCWINILYPKHNAKLHITYLPVNNHLEFYLEDAYQFAFKHEMKATAINTSRVDVPDHKVGSLIYDIKGDVASSLQFFATDSLDHFLRGSLYFSNSPNEDSIAPVLSYLREDLIRLIETLEWQ